MKPTVSKTTNIDIIFFIFHLYVMFYENILQYVTYFVNKFYEL